METTRGSYEKAAHAAISKLQECSICCKIQRKVCIPCSHVICTDCAQNCTKNKTITCPWKCGPQTLPAGGCREVTTLNEFSDFLVVTSSNVQKCIRHIFCESRYVRITILLPNNLLSTRPCSITTLLTWWSSQQRQSIFLCTTILSIIIAVFYPRLII